jgi:hypothetical protein
MPYSNCNTLFSTRTIFFLAIVVVCTTNADMTLPTPVRLPDKLHEELQGISAEMNISKSAIIRFCVSAMLPEIRHGRLTPPNELPRADRRSQPDKNESAPRDVNSRTPAKS